MELKEALSCKDIEVKTDNFNIKLNPWKLRFWAQLEEEGHNREDVIAGIHSKPVTFVTKVIWLIMKEESRNYFKDNFDTFLDLYDYSYIDMLTLGIYESMMAGAPKELPEDMKAKIKDIRKEADEIEKKKNQTGTK